MFMLHKRSHSFLQSQHLENSLFSQRDWHLQSPSTAAGGSAQGRTTTNIIWEKPFGAQPEMLRRMSKPSLNLHSNDFQGSWGGACRNPESGDLYSKECIQGCHFFLTVQFLKIFHNLIPKLPSKLHKMYIFFSVTKILTLNLIIS